jgi:GST-like protein
MLDLCTAATPNGKKASFSREQPPNKPAAEKFLDESKRLAQVLDARLEDRHYIAGDYSIADIACYPWFEGITKFEASIILGLPQVESWMLRMSDRPAVQKGMRLGRNE